jgi:ferredoxin-NADP reductase
MKAQVKSIKALPGEAYELQLSPQNTSESKFRFEAGQYMTLNFPGLGKRYYSIASDERNPSLILALIRAPKDSDLGKHLSQLKAGSELELEGPAGNVRFSKSHHHHFFISTGSGLAPHLAILESYLDRRPKDTFELLFGTFNEATNFYLPQIKKLEATFPHFKAHFVYSDKLIAGENYVQNKIKNFSITNESAVYLCGQKEMILETENELSKIGYEISKVIKERY